MVTHSSLRHHDQEFEIRSVNDENGITVLAYADGKAVGPRYMVSFETASDFVTYHGGSAVEQFVEIARNDVLAGHITV